MTGVLRELDSGASNTRFKGYRNRGGTLDVFGMLVANKQSWVHILAESVEVIPDINMESIFDPNELSALHGKTSFDALTYGR